MKAKHHYVPEWYQRRFIPASSKDNNLWCLDIDPQPIAHPGGHHYHPNPLRRGADVCFHEPGLYTLRFGKHASDVIETHFFGDIDRTGAVAVDAMADFVFGQKSPNIRHLAQYLDAQKMRTPKGLDLVKAMAKTEDHQSAVLLMRDISQIHMTILMEGVWEVFKCDHTSTKLLISDHPVATYNRQLPPGGKEYQYPFDPGIDLIGTQSLYPLCSNRLLVITNLEFVRNHWINGKSQRTNPRAFGDTLFFLGNIHTGRQLNEGEVRAVNYIIKRTAKKFIAAGEEEWLYPEDTVKTKAWNNLGGEFFLRPDPRRMGFAGASYIGFKDGTSWGMDEYGRPPNDDDPDLVAQRDREREYWAKTMAYWEQKRGPLPPGSMLGMP